MDVYETLGKTLLEELRSKKLNYTRTKELLVAADSGLAERAARTAIRRLAYRLMLEDCPVLETIEWAEQQVAEIRKNLQKQP